MLPKPASNSFFSPFVLTPHPHISTRFLNSSFSFSVAVIGKHLLVEHQEWGTQEAECSPEKMCYCLQCIQHIKIVIFFFQLLNKIVLLFCMLQKHSLETLLKEFLAFRLCNLSQCFKAFLLICLANLIWAQSFIPCFLTTRLQGCLQKANVTDTCYNCFNWSVKHCNRMTFTITCLKPQQ